MQIVKDERVQMNKKQWILLVIWFAAYITAMQFLRFKFGIFTISGVAVVIGVALMLLLGKSNKPNSS